MTASLWLPIGFAVTAGAALAASFALSPTARLVPAVASATMLALLGVEIAAVVRARRRSPRGERTPVSAGREAIELLWVASLPVVATALGLVIGLPVFLFAYLKLRAGVTRWIAAIAALVCWAVLEIVLRRVLGVSVP
jgi:hypothetical protein